MQIGPWGTRSHGGPQSTPKGAISAQCNYHLHLQWLACVEGRGTQLHEAVSVFGKENTKLDGIFKICQSTGIVRYTIDLRRSYSQKAHGFRSRHC